MLKSAGYVSFQRGKWREHAYEIGGFTEGMSDLWLPEERGQPGRFRHFVGGTGLDLVREILRPVLSFIDCFRDQL